MADHIHTEACNHGPGGHGPPAHMQQLEPSVFKRWFTIYPCYINALLSIQGGRRLPKDKCVPNPQVPELSHCLSFLKLKHVVEPVCHHLHFANLYRINRTLVTGVIQDVLSSSSTTSWAMLKTPKFSQVTNIHALKLYRETSDPQDARSIP